MISEKELAAVYGLEERISELMNILEKMECGYFIDTVYNSHANFIRAPMLATGIATLEKAIATAQIELRKYISVDSTGDTKSE